MKRIIFILAIAITGCERQLADSIEKGVRDAQDAHTSIVVEYDGVGWCRLTGPARYAALADIESCAY